MAVTRPNEIAVLLDLNTRLAGGDPPAVLLPRIVEEAQTLTGGDAVVIRLIERDHLTLAARSSRTERLDLAERIPIGAGIAGAVARDGTAVICDDLRADLRLYPPHRESVLAAGFRSYVTLPLRTGAGVIGTLSVYADRPGAFDGGSLGLFTAFADQAAIALEKAGLLERARRQTARLVALHRIAATILRQTDEERTIRHILEEARGLLGVPGVALYLVDADSPQIQARMSTMPAGHFPASVPVGEGVLGRVVEDRRAITIDDYATSPLALPEARSIGTRALVAAPLLVGDRPLGALAAWSTDADFRFSPDDEQLVLLFAEHAALALENARLHQAAAAEAEAEASRDVLDALLRTAEALARASTVSDVARVLAELAPRFFACDATVVRIRRDDGSFPVTNLAGDWTDDERRYILRHDPATAPLFQKLAAERRTIAIEELEGSGLVPPEELATVRRRSTIVMPLLARGDLLGYLSINYTRAVRRFSQRDVALADGIARQAAMALDNLRLRQRDWEAARLDGAMKLARDTAAELNQPLRAAAEEAKQALAEAGRTPATTHLTPRIEALLRAIDLVEATVRRLQQSTW